MAKFEIGDEVTVIENWYDIDPKKEPNRIETGKTYTIREIWDDELEFEGLADRGYADSNWKLVTKGPAELQRLVRLANEGYDALKILVQEYAADIEIKYLEIVFPKKDVPPTTGDYRQISPMGYNRIRIKPKPKFEPFVVGKAATGTRQQMYHSGWLVQMVGNDILIGDTLKFNYYLLLCALTDLTRGSAEQRKAGMHEIGCMRNGVIFDGKYLISWEDADKLVTELEKFHG